MNSLPSLLVALVVFHTTFVCSTPVKTSEENVDEVEVVVGVEDSKIVEVNQKSAQPAKIAGSLVKDVKQINLFLNIPTGCNSIYDKLITQLVGCRNGHYRGHPRLEKGCLLKMDFKKFKDECAERGAGYGLRYALHWGFRVCCLSSPYIYSRNRRGHPSLLYISNNNYCCAYWY